MEKFDADLFLVATPIGNLSDMSFRALEVLKNADLIAAEDTRNTIKLLNYYDIKTKMTSYHKHNKLEKANYLIEFMKDGNTLALVSDAGMPAISDPGEDLVRLAYENGLKVSIIPGACAAISAVAISGLSSRRFCFEGFLPSDNKERKKILEELKYERRSIVMYEAPHRLKKTIDEIISFMGEERKISIVKEITKKHETVIRMNAIDIKRFYEENEPKGEFVLVIEGDNSDEKIDWQDLDIKSHMKIYEDGGMDRKDAMKAVAKDRGISKREVYEYIMKGR